MKDGAQVSEIALTPVGHGQEAIQEGVVDLVGVVKGTPIAVLSKQYAVAVVFHRHHSATFRFVVDVVIHLTFVYIAVFVGPSDF